MHWYAKNALTLSAGFLLGAVSALAAGSSMHMVSGEFDVTQTMTIGTTELQPGNYVIQGQESQPQLNILQNDKVIATVPCHWVRLDKKAPQTEVLSTNNQVTEVEFQGRKEAAKIG